MSPSPQLVPLLSLLVWMLGACTGSAAGPTRRSTHMSKPTATPPQLCFVAEERGELRTTTLCLGSLDGKDPRFILRSHQTVPDASFTRMLGGVFERQGQLLLLRPQRSSAGTTNHQRGVHNSQATQDRRPREAVLAATGKALTLKQPGKADLVLVAAPR